MRKRADGRRLNYANIAASLALFIALGGTSYALTLPPNSVGSKQIRTKAVGASEIRAGAVRSSEVRDRSLSARDLSPATRASLRGQTGPQGPVGPVGPAAITRYAVINAVGQLVRGNPKFKTRRGLNEYLVEFDRSAADCAATATLAGDEATGAVAPAGRVTMAREGTVHVVRTYDVNGAPAAIGFHLIVAC